MTIDREKLKALAEQASRPGWRWMTEFTLAAGPEVILGLITEIEQLKSALDMESAELAWSDSDGRAIQSERDQLKAENEALQKDLPSLRGSCKAMGEELALLRKRNKSLARAVVWFASRMGEHFCEKPSWLKRIVGNLMKKGDS